MPLRFFVFVCCLTGSTCWADVFDVYIAAGQSNMAGRGRTSALTGAHLAPYAIPHPDVLLHYTNPRDPASDPVSRPTYQSNGWVPLEPGYTVPSESTSPGTFPSDRFGPEVSFGHSMDSSTTGRSVAIIKVTRGGTNLRDDWDPSDGAGDPKGYMYQGFEAAVPAAIQALQALGHSVEIRGMIWHQGESDGAAGQAAYEANLTEFIQVVRQDLGYPNLPFLIGELESASGGRVAVRTAQRNVAAAMDFVEFVPSTGLAVSDGTHFNTAGVIELGKRFAFTMQTSISNLPGDFNRDGVVNHDDYSVWAAFQGSMIDARADANNDGLVDHLDLAVWQAAVPEPAAVVMAALAVLCGGGACLGLRHRRPESRKTQQPMPPMIDTNSPCKAIH